MDADKRGRGFHPAQLFLFMLEYRRLTKWKIVFPKKKKAQKVQKFTLSASVRLYPGFLQSSEVVTKRYVFFR